MKLTYKIFAGVAATLSLAVAGAVFAHPGSGTGYGMGPGMGPVMRGGMGPGMGGGMGRWMGGSDMAAVAAGRTAELKAELKITPAQETAWKAFDAVVQQRASAMHAMRGQMQAQMQSQQPGTGSTDFAAQREAMIKQHDASEAAHRAALKDLYTVLTPEQRAIVDRNAIGMGGHRAARNGPAR